MSMLAERRKKTRYVINPTKKPLWTTDSSGIKFGKELMEKMGWSAGKGLGANEQGIQEPLRVSYKNDNKGMGYKGSEENWIECQDEFNVLLNQLSSNTVQNVKTKTSELISLEEKSKLSKARVHYQKFTRGKDISKYSENDLSCILGTGKLKKANNKTVIEKEAVLENNTHETSFGVTTINSGSIKDYFKKKWTLSNLKAANSNVEQSQSVFGEEQEFNERNNTGLKKKLKVRQKENKEESLKNEYETEGNENVEETKKHKKKRKKLGLHVEIPCKKEREIKTETDDKVQKIERKQLEIVYNSPEDILMPCNQDIVKTKKKKRNYEELRPVDVELKTQSEGLVEKIKNKKRKKEKESGINSVGNSLNVEEINGNVKEEDLQNETQKEDCTKKKKRKKEKKSEKIPKTDNNFEIEVKEGTMVEELKNYTKNDAEEKTIKKKKKDAELQEKDKSDCEKQLDNQKNLLKDVEEVPVKKKKKKKEKEIKDLEKGGLENDEKSARENFEADIFKEKKKKKTCLEKSEKEEEQKNKEILGTPISIKGALTEKKVKDAKKENAEVQSQPEEMRKRNKKNKKEKKEKKFVNRDDQVEAKTLESQDKESKRKGKTKSKSSSETVDPSETFRETENEMSSVKEEKENKSEKVKSKGEGEVTFIHTHKAALFQMRKPFVRDNFEKYSIGKALKLICGAEISKFKGANLESIPGYGYRKEIENKHKL